MPGMNLTRAEARERAELIAVDSYEVELDLTRGEKVFGTTTAVKFTATPGSSTFIDAVTARRAERDPERARAGSGRGFRQHPHSVAGAGGR